MSNVRVQSPVYYSGCSVSESCVSESKVSESSVSVYSVSGSNVLEFSVSDSIIRLHCVRGYQSSVCVECVEY